MSPHKQPPNNEAQAVASGNLLLTYFFAKKKRWRGRPNKRGNMADDIIVVLTFKKENIGQPLSQTSEYLHTSKPPPPPKTKLVVENHPPPTILKVTKNISRTNWVKVKHKDRIFKALDDWGSRGVYAIYSNEGRVPLSEFSNLVGMTYNTLKHYIKRDK